MPIIHGVASSNDRVNWTPSAQESLGTFSIQAVTLAETGSNRSSPAAHQLSPVLCLGLPLLSRALCSCCAFVNLRAYLGLHGP